MLKRDHSAFSVKFDNELFYVYDFLLKKGYYKSTVTEFFPDELFRNILKLGLKLKNTIGCRILLKTILRDLYLREKKHV